MHIVTIEMNSVDAIVIIDKLSMLMERHSNNINSIINEIYSSNNEYSLALLCLMVDLCEFTEKVLNVPE